MEYEYLTVDEQELLVYKLDLRNQTKSGNRINCSCPHHEETKPSMFITLDEMGGVYRCFSCDVRGTVANLFYTLTGRSAYKELGKRKDGLVDLFAHKKYTERIKLMKQKAKVDHFDIRGVKMPWKDSALCRDYLMRRGIDFDFAEKYGFEYADEITINGMLFKSRLLIPIVDETGKVINYEGRLADPSLDAPKVLYPKNSDSEILFELQNLSYDQPLYVVEGLMDLFKLLELRENSTSVFGSKIGDKQFELLNRFKSIIIIPDNDKAGFEMVIKLAKNLKVPVTVCEVPKPHNDLGECLQGETEELLSKEITDSILWANRKLDEITLGKALSFSL